MNWLYQHLIMWCDWCVQCTLTFVWSLIKGVSQKQSCGFMDALATIVFFDVCGFSV